MNDAVTKPVFDFNAAWAVTRGDQMAGCFTDDAHFVASDGTRLIGGKTIGDWHQPALDTVLSSHDAQHPSRRRAARRMRLTASLTCKSSRPAWCD